MLQWASKHMGTIRVWGCRNHGLAIWGSNNKPVDYFETDLQGLVASIGSILLAVKLNKTAQWNQLGRLSAYNESINLTTTRWWISHADATIISIHLNEIYRTIPSTLIWSICQKKGWRPVFLHLGTGVCIRTGIPWNPIKRNLRISMFKNVITHVVSALECYQCTTETKNKVFFPSVVQNGCLILLEHSATLWWIDHITSFSVNLLKNWMLLEVDVYRKDFSWETSRAKLNKPLSNFVVKC